MYLEDYDGEEWKLGFIAFQVDNINLNSKEVDLKFYNYDLEKFVILNNISFNDLFSISEVRMTESNIINKKVLRFKTYVSGLDLDEIVRRAAIMKVGYGIPFIRENYLANDTSYNYKNGGNLFCSSNLISMMNYIRYVALKNNRKEDFDKVLDVFDENIKEFEANMVVL